MKLILILILLFQLNLSAQDDSAYIQIDFSKDRIEYDTPKFGNFIEYYMNFMNGPNGIWAQELHNRGFDIENTWSTVSNYWEPFTTYWDDNSKWGLRKGGYNENGQLYQQIISLIDTIDIGVTQEFYTTKHSGYSFYVYLRSKDDIPKVDIKVLSSENKVLWEGSLGKPDTIWRKFSIEIPEIENNGKVKIAIIFSGSGTLDVDEASLIPKNAINGIRNEYYKLFSEWKPDILRYPGGWFVEFSGYHWEMGLGQIDKRTIYENLENLRLDFGLVEFLEFCEHFEIEPHLVVSFIFSTPKDAANIVEFCNGDTSTVYGRLRAEFGRIEPYSVKTWEIGNEVWDDTINYGKGFVDFNNAMKLVDPTITTMISADIWQWKPFFEKLIPYIKNYCDIYGWHWAQGLKPKEKVTDRNIYLSAVGGSQITLRNIDALDSWIRDAGQQNQMHQAVTEVWSEYNPDAYEWDHDTTLRAGSLENGLWMAAQNIAALKRAKSIKIFEKTHSTGTFRCFFDDITHERKYYKTPSYWACQLLQNHLGDKTIKTIVISDAFSQRDYEGLYGVDNALWISAASTKSDDTLFLYVLNRHPSNAIRTYLNFPAPLLDKNAKVYYLSSNSFLDANTPDKPNFVHPREDTWKVNNTFYFPKHSFTIIAVPLNKDTNIYNEYHNDLMIDYYPNPFTDFIKIESENINFNPTDISMFDIVGKEIDYKFFKTDENSFIIYSKNLQSGVYFIQLNIENETIVKKVIKF